MKRLITLSGPGGRAVLELGATARLSVPVGKLHLADKRGCIHPADYPAADVIGGFVTENGRILMQGSLAGYSSVMAKARAELLMGLAPEEKAPANIPAKRRAPAPSGQMPAQPRPGSAVLLEILQRASELFPPEQPQPEPQPENDSPVVNPFPEAFPFSRWKRVEYPGTDRCYLEGEARNRGVDYIIHALPGDRRATPPPGYSRFLRARDGSGFWVRIRRKQ